MELIFFGALWIFWMRRQHLAAEQRIALGRLGRMAGIARSISGPYRRRR